MIEATIRRRFTSIAIATAFLVASVFAVITPVSAQSPQEQSQQPVVEACDELASRIDQIISDFNVKRESHIEKYSAISGLYSSILYQLEKSDYSTEILKELQPGLERRIASFSDTSSQFIFELEDVRDSSCRDKASFEQELEEARTSLKVVQDSVADIQDHVQLILLPAIRNLVNGGGDN